MDEQAISDDGSKFVSDAIDFALKWSLREKWWNFANHGNYLYRRIPRSCCGSFST